MKNLIIPIAIAAFIFLGYFVLNPITTVEQEDCIQMKAHIYRVYAGPNHDIVFVVEGDHRTFYINRGEENGLSAHRMNAQLKGKKVNLWYFDHWSLLNFNKKLCHVSRVEFQEEVLFSEIADM